MNRVETMQTDKTQLRRQLQQRVILLTEQERAVKSKKACQHLIATPEFQKASTIMIFLSLPHEVDTTEVILHAWQMGKIVAVPKVSWEQRHMIPVEINTLESGFSAEAAGLRNPIGGMPTPFADIDLVVAPAIGVDMKGNRLGRGGAYYDRFFAEPELRAARCALVFSEQVAESIPVTPHDQAIDFLVTDEQVVYFTSA